MQPTATTLRKRCSAVARMIIRARAPLRLGLAGGGTDVSPFCDIHGGCVLNATIDRYAYAVIRTLDEPVVQLQATDQQAAEIHNFGETLALNGSLNLHKAVYNHMVQHYNAGKQLSIDLSTFCDAPVGSGLGSSSTLVVAMLKAFAELLNLALDDYSIAQLAYKLERVDCGLQGGRQDQYSAAFGGFNFMEFYADEHAIITPLRVKSWIISELEACMILFFTGVSRESAHIIADQSSNIEAGDPEALTAMHGLKREAIMMKQCLLRADFKGLVEYLRTGWEHKKNTAKTVSNSHLNAIYSAAIKAGALAGKVSGAGGGGFMLFFVPPERRMEVIRSLNQFEGTTSNCHFTKHGTQAWSVNS